jgi:hypothetical protein
MDNNLSKNKSDMVIKTKGFSVNRMLIFQPSHGENKLHFDEKMMMSAQMDFYSASSVKQQSMGRHCSTWTYYSNSEATSLCSYLIMLFTEWRNSKY